MLATWMASAAEEEGKGEKEERRDWGREERGRGREGRERRAGKRKRGKRVESRGEGERKERGREGRERRQWTLPQVSFAVPWCLYMCTSYCIDSEGRSTGCHDN